MWRGWQPLEVFHLPADVRAERLRRDLDAISGCLPGGEHHSTLATGVVHWETWTGALGHLGNMQNGDVDEVMMILIMDSECVYIYIDYG